MKSNILKYSLLLLMIVFSVSLSAQKDVRKNVRKGNKAYQQQKFSEAFTFYNDALTENPSSPEANYNTGNTLYRQKEWDKSLESYNQFLALEKENPVRFQLQYKKQWKKPAAKWLKSHSKTERSTMQQ